MIIVHKKYKCDVQDAGSCSAGLKLFFLYVKSLY